jgi:CheY-like chemotaxis protein
MVRNVLIVDDDRILRRLIKKKMEKYAPTFKVVSAADGIEAVEVLKQKAISLVISDLDMPRMDGFALVAHLTVHYPDIPVIVLTADRTQQSRMAVLEGGAAGFIEKPFVVEELGPRIIQILKKESEGGVLQTISLEMFTQLVAMEQKTCTIRVINKDDGQKGVLFFQKGELLDARKSEIQGKDAAYKIFSWSQIILFIEDNCALKEKRIDDDLQAIVMDAMRLKDEIDSDSADMVPDAIQIPSLSTPEGSIYREAMGLHERLLSVMPTLEDEKRLLLQEKIRLFQKEIDLLSS